MPRRYRPPTRRRKLKKQLPGEIEVPSYEGAVSPAPAPPPVTAHPPTLPEHPSQISHIARDHSYVPGDLRRIALIVAFIVAGLVIAAILR